MSAGIVMQCFCCARLRTGGGGTGSQVPTSHAACAPRSLLLPAGTGWELEKMPLPRVMGDTIILPNGKVVVLNGAMVRRLPTGA